MQHTFANFGLFIFRKVVCSETLKVWWAMSHGFCCKFIGKYNSERILKIRQQ